ncbi:MAG: hypothetical protein LBI86_01565 [Treponema sp.]|jgi:hypothetical protein|nr:hypothetical protein [Treponema sp.]
MPPQAEKKQAEQMAAWKKAVEGAANETSDNKKNVKKPENPSVFQNPQRKNKIVRAGTIALKRAFNKEMIDKDITAGITSGTGSKGQADYRRHVAMRGGFL